MLIDWHARWKECGNATLWQLRASDGPTRPGTVISVVYCGGACNGSFFPFKFFKVIRSLFWQARR